MYLNHFVEHAGNVTVYEDVWFCAQRETFKSDLQRNIGNIVHAALSRLTGQNHGAEIHETQYITGLGGEKTAVSTQPLSRWQPKCIPSCLPVPLLKANATIMPSAEWRLFLPNVDVHRPPAEARPLMALLDHVSPAVRTDVYLKADADIGVKRRVSDERARSCSAARAVKGSWCGRSRKTMQRPFGNGGALSVERLSGEKLETDSPACWFFDRCVLF